MFRAFSYTTKEQNHCFAPDVTPLYEHFFTTKKPDTISDFRTYPMRKKGLEPSRRCQHQILSLACLPIPALPHFIHNTFVCHEQDIYYQLFLHLSTLFYYFFSQTVTVQPKKDESIIHELAQCIIDLFFGAELLRQTF